MGALFAFAMGLSPRVRGNLERRAGGGGWLGSIPARAGEPWDAAGLGSGVWVYPRACGGTLITHPDFPLATGLSPRVRGNLQASCGRAREDGSIPARAGEPGRPGRRPAMTWVYPRACGGTLVRPTEAVSVAGLSPRVRGNPLDESVPPGRTWSIPARAGEPTRRARSMTAPRVYPRACGGTVVEFGKTLRLSGLSPRVRGNLWPR